MKPVILGVCGTSLLAEEATLLRAHAPAGVMLFKRNIETPAQLARLIAELRDALPAAAVIAVDQEGGRVARLRPPHWMPHPPAKAIGALYLRDPAAGIRAAWLHGALIGTECRQAGFDMVAAPVLDLALPGQSEVVGDRSFGAEPEQVGRLGLAMAQGLAGAGVIAVGKHVPGHGRARVDSHQDLPRIAADQAAFACDIAPFAAVAGVLPCLMTAHIVFEGLDDDRPATLSPTVIHAIIRKRIGFDGLLISDDLAMGALTGAPAHLADEALSAGCDIALYCPGDLAQNAAVLERLSPSPALQARLHDMPRTPQQDAQTDAWFAERTGLLDRQG